MLDLNQQEIEAVRNILNRFVPDAETILFGSTIHGTAKPWSDLDLAIKSKSVLPRLEAENRVCGVSWLMVSVVVEILAEARGALISCLFCLRASLAESSF